MHMANPSCRDLLSCMRHVVVEGFDDLMHK
jgi:hypothetical protein